MVKQLLSAFFAGALFGFGLCVSRMTDPSVVVAFLDITGQWDPRLLFVMGGALLVAMPVFPLILKSCRSPVCGEKFSLPAGQAIDKPLVIGSVLFGIGWGLGGVCPGPAVTALSFGAKEAFIFFAALAAGMVLFEKWKIMKS